MIRYVAPGRDGPDVEKYASPGVGESPGHPPGMEQSVIVEHVDITVEPGREEEFEAAFTRGREVLAKAKGFRWARLLRGVESPASFLLLIGWDTLEDHTVGFRESELFPQWRAIVGPLFAVAPTIVHYEGDLSG